MQCRCAALTGAHGCLSRRPCPPIGCHLPGGLGFAKSPSGTTPRQGRGEGAATFIGPRGCPSVGYRAAIGAAVRGRGLSPRRGSSRRNPSGARRWVRRPSCVRSRHPPGAASREGARLRAREGALRPGEEPGMPPGKAHRRAGVAVR